MQKPYVRVLARKAFGYLGAAVGAAIVNQYDAGGGKGLGQYGADGGWQGGSGIAEWQDNGNHGAKVGRVFSPP
jgi:hypothetical protein